MFKLPVSFLEISIVLFWKMFRFQRLEGTKECLCSLLESVHFNLAFYMHTTDQNTSLNFMKISCGLFKKAMFSAGLWK